MNLWFLKKYVLYELYILYHNLKVYFEFFCIGSFQGMKIPSYDNQLLDLAEDLARRLLPAFDTPTGIFLIGTWYIFFDRHSYLWECYSRTFLQV